MSKRRRRDAPGRDRDEQARAADRQGRAADRQGRAPDPARRDRRAGGIARDLLILAASFGLGVAIAELAGAANLGVAFGVGQVVFALVLVVLLTRE